MSPETTTQNKQSQQNPQTSQTQQSSSASRQSTGTDRQGTTGDQQRSIATSRESGSSAQSSATSGASTGVARQQDRAPVYGSRGALSDPFTLMQRMSADMDRLFEQFGFGSSLAGMPFGGNSLTTNVWSPQIETFRRGDQLVIRADVPGVRKDDLHIEVDDGVLMLSGERRSENEENRDGYYRSERSYGQFQRAIPLPEGVNADQCQASFSDGVLEVTLPAPKEQERKAKRIEIH